MNIIKFIEDFPTEASCRNHFREVRKEHGMQKMWFDEALFVQKVNGCGNAVVVSLGLPCEVER